MACNLPTDLAEILQSMKQSVSGKFWVTSVISNATRSSYLSYL